MEPDSGFIPGYSASMRADFLTRKTRLAIMRTRRTEPFAHGAASAPCRTTVPGRKRA
jgi:hypothetical protein